MRIKIRRMANAARQLLTGTNAPAEGELVYATDTKLVYVGDGSTAGGNLINAISATHPTTGKPTAAPTAASPATELTNTNGEVFRWNGTGWYLSGNGYKLTDAAPSAPLATGTYVYAANVTAPRSGSIDVCSEVYVQTTAAPLAAYIAAYVFVNGAFKSRVSIAENSSNLQCAGYLPTPINAGDVISLIIDVNAPTPGSYSLIGALLTATYTK